jgi:hypothetical protein
VGVQGDAPGAETVGREARVDRWLTGALCLLAVALAVIATWNGPGLSVDAINYLTAGINLAEGRGLRMLGDQALTAFPPGLPLLAALGEALGIGAETTLRWVSALAFGAIVALGHGLLTRIVSHRGVVIGATALLSVSPVLLSITTMAISEPPFIVVTLAFLLVLGGVCERGMVSRGDVALLAILSSLGFLFRYIGLALVPVGGAALLLTVRPLGRRTMWRIVCLGLWSALVPIACMLRNHAADGTYLGNRVPTWDSLADVTYRAARTFGEWIYPVHGLSARVAALVGVAGLVLGLGAAGLAYRGRSNLPRRARTQLLCCAMFLLVYLVCLIAAALNAQVVLTTRLLSPVFVPAVIILASCVAAGLARLPSRAWRVGAGGILASLVAFQGLAAVDDARQISHHGVNYDDPALKESGIAVETARLMEATPGAVVYSNEPYGLWVGTGIRPIFWAPREARFRGARVTGELDALEWRVACSWPAAYLAVSLRGSYRVTSVDEIREALDVTRVAVADDGAVFRLRSRSEPDCSDPPTCTLESVPWRCEGDR